MDQAPADTELRNIIDKLAQFVARNGPEFEHMTKNKQKDNPKFSFLFGGEYFNYYQYKVTTEQAILKQKGLNPMQNADPRLNVSQQQQPPPQQIINNVGVTQNNGLNSVHVNMGPGTNAQNIIPPGPPNASPMPGSHNLGPGHMPGQNSLNRSTGWLQSELANLQTQQSTLQDQVRQSEQNLAAQHAALMAQQQGKVEDAVRQAQETTLQSTAQSTNTDLAGFDAVLQPIIDSCTKDSISAGKAWILQHSLTLESNQVIAEHLLKRVIQETTFNSKLHIIYLVNDVLHHCARKKSVDLRKAMESVVVPMFCNASLAATEEQVNKLNKLLSLWESKNNYFEEGIIEKLKKPRESWSDYQSSVMAQHASTISSITTTTKQTFDNYQAQHQAFVNHALRQIQTIEQQKVVIDQQLKTPHPAPVQVNQQSLPPLSQPPPVAPQHSLPHHPPPRDGPPLDERAFSGPPRDERGATYGISSHEERGPSYGGHDDRGPPYGGPPRDDRVSSYTGPPHDERGPAYGGPPHDDRLPYGGRPHEDRGMPYSGPSRDDRGPPYGAPPHEDRGPPYGGPPRDDRGPPYGGPPRDDRGPPYGGPPHDDRGPPYGGPHHDDRGPSYGGLPHEDRGSLYGGPPHEDRGPPYGVPPHEDRSSTYGGPPRDDRGPYGALPRDDRGPPYGGLPHDDRGPSYGGPPHDDRGPPYGGLPHDDRGPGYGGPPHDDRGHHYGGPPHDDRGPHYGGMPPSHGAPYDSRGSQYGGPPPLHEGRGPPYGGVSSHEGRGTYGGPPSSLDGMHDGLPYGSHGGHGSPPHGRMHDDYPPYRGPPMSVSPHGAPPYGGPHHGGPHGPPPRDLGPPHSGPVPAHGPVPHEGPPYGGDPSGYNQPPPSWSAPPRGGHAADSNLSMPDFSKPPPGFGGSHPPPLMAQEINLSQEDLMPSMPYFDLPAGLMVPLIKLEDCNYKPLDPDAIRLPAPAPPSERLLAAVEAFYTVPSHESPRDSDGWERLGLYEYYKAKNSARKKMEEEIKCGMRQKSRSPSPIIRPRSKSPSPPKKRYRSKSKSKSRSRSRSRSRERSRSKSPQATATPSSKRSSRNSRNRRRRNSNKVSDQPPPTPDRRQDRSDRSPTPPSFLGATYGKPQEVGIDESNKGHQLLRKMGWGGAGLGVKEQGIEAPISGGDIRDRNDMYKGIGINLNDPYENFRKCKGQAFITRMKARAEERAEERSDRMERMERHERD